MSKCTLLCSVLFPTMTNMINGDFGVVLKRQNLGLLRLTLRGTGLGELCLT